MYELDHMLNGSGSRQHLQHMIQEAHHERIARDAEAGRGKKKTISPVRAVLIVLINLVTR